MLVNLLRALLLEMKAALAPLLVLVNQLTLWLEIKAALVLELVIGLIVILVRIAANVMDVARDVVVSCLPISATPRTAMRITSMPMESVNIARTVLRSYGVSPCFEALTSKKILLPNNDHQYVDVECMIFTIYNVHTNRFWCKPMLLFIAKNKIKHWRGNVQCRFRHLEVRLRTSVRNSSPS